MTFWILLAIAGFLTLLSIRMYNIIFSLAASLGWFAVWGYHLNNPPANITIGTFVYDLLYYIFIIMAIVVMYIYFRNRGKQTSVTKISAENNEIVARTYNGGMEETPDEYRMRVRRALRSRRTR